MDWEDYYIALHNLQASNDEERRHVENIHILITTALIASYFTPSLQDFISESGLRIHTNALVTIAILYLVIRLVDVTVPIRDVHRSIELLFGVIAPLGFLISVLGYFTLSVAIVFDLQPSVESMNLIIVFITIISSYLAWRSAEEESKRSGTGESAESFINRAQEYENYVYLNPDIVEEGLEWDSMEVYPPGYDFTGTDSQGNRVLAEMKIGDLKPPRIDKVVNQMLRYRYEDANAEESRLLLITDRDIPQTAKSKLKEHDIEHVVVDFDNIP